MRIPPAAMRLEWNRVTRFSQFVAIVLFVGVFALGFCLGKQYGRETSGLEAVAVVSYVTEHIRELSPEKEVLGGTFYVTEIEAKNGAGTVWYEDGHNAFVADFTYTMKGEIPAVTSFDIRQ